MVISLAVVALMTVLVVFALTSTKTVPSHGTVSAFKLSTYTDATHTVALDTFDWNTVNPGGSTYKDVYVMNDGGDLAMAISITYGDCLAHIGASPTHNVTGIGMTITSDLPPSTSLNKGAGILVRFTLTVPDNADTQLGVVFDVPISFIGTNP
jgi:hypothetical protein